MNDKNHYWIVMKLHDWSNITVMGFELAAQKNGPQKFIPAFETREQAIEWAGSDEHVVEVRAAG